MNDWKPNEHWTIGIEQEYHLIDPETGDLAPRMEAVWGLLEGEMKEAACYELVLSCLEMRTPVCAGPDELHQAVIDQRRTVGEAAARAGVVLVASGSHPFADWRRQPRVETDHYQWVHRHHGYLARRLLSWGLHVHVGMKTVESALFAMHEMKRWLYPLLALSANSPFYEGERTGLASTRTHLFGSMPRTGAPPDFASYDELKAHYKRLLRAGDIQRPGDLWWSIRPQPPLGTVEVRVFDLPTEPLRVAVFGALCQAAMATYEEQFNAGVRPSRFGAHWLEQNRWQAMRYGLEANVVDPESEDVHSVRRQLERFFDLISPKAEALGSLAWVERARRIAEEGNEAAWQVETLERLGGDLRALEFEIARRTMRFG